MNPEVPCRGRAGRPPPAPARSRFPVRPLPLAASPRAPARRAWRRYILALGAGLAAVAAATGSLVAWAPGAPSARHAGSLPGAAVVTLTLAAPEALTVGHAASVTVRALGPDGLPVDESVAVSITATAGEVSPAHGAAQAGAFTTTYRAFTGTSTIVLAAEAATAATNAKITLLPDVSAAIGFRAVPPEIIAGAEVPLSVAVKDQHDNPVADGTAVRWRVETTATESAASLAATRDGVAMTTFTSTVAVPHRVHATAAETVEVSTTVRVVPAPAEVLLVAMPRRIAIDSEAEVDLTSVDRYGNRAREPLAIHLDAGGGTVDPSIVLLERGRGEARYRSGDDPGEYVLAATSGGLVGSTAFALRPADLALELGVRGPDGSVPDTQVHPGDRARFDVVVRNGDLATAREPVLGVIVPDALAREATESNVSVFPRSEGPPGLVEEPPEHHTALYWDLPDIGAGELVTLTLPGEIRADLAWTGFDTVFFRGAVQSRTPDAGASDQARGRAVPVHAADLFVDVSLDPGSSALRPGGTVVYDIAVGNRAQATELRDVRAVDTLPFGTSFVHWEPHPGTEGLRPVGTFEPGDAELEWRIDEVTGAGVGWRLRLAIDDDLSPDAVIHNTVAVHSDVHDVNPMNDIGRSTAPLRGVNLEARVEAPGTVAPAGEIAYELTVRNLAQRDTATGVKAVSRPPPGLSVVSRTPGGVVGADGSIAWEIASIAPGGRAVFEVVVRVPESAPIGSLLRHDFAVSAAESESFPADNEAHGFTEIIPGPPSTIALATGGELSACPGAPIVLEAHLRDRFGHWVADGTRVTWSVTRGQVVEATAAQDGVATAAYEPGGQPGDAVITARAGQVEEEMELSLPPGAPRGIALTALPSIVGAHGVVAITGHVFDGCSNLVVDGLDVTLQADRGVFEGGGSSLRRSTVNGRVDGRLAVGGALGPMRVRARHENVTSETIVSVVPPERAPTPSPNARRILVPLAIRP